MLMTIWAKPEVKEDKEHIPYRLSIDGVLVSDPYIDTIGRRRSMKIINTVVDHKGYKRFSTKSLKSPSVARNVAKCFINGGSKYLEVNHKDGNKFNNSIENLEWVTTGENIRHAIDNNLRHPCLVAGWNKGRKATYKRVVSEYTKKKSRDSNSAVIDGDLEFYLDDYLNGALLEDIVKAVCEDYGVSYQPKSLMKRLRRIAREKGLDLSIGDSIRKSNATKRSRYGLY